MPTSQGKIPIEEIAKFPPPGMSIPVSFSFSPDDTLLAYLYGPDQSPIRQLYALDTETGESRVIQASVDPDAVDLSLEEQLLRQRQRQLGQGIVRYSWADERDVYPDPGAVRCLPQGRHRLPGPPAGLVRLRAGHQSPAIAGRFDGRLRPGHGAPPRVCRKRRDTSDHPRSQRHGQDPRTRRVHRTRGDESANRILVVK